MKWVFMVCGCLFISIAACQEQTIEQIMEDHARQDENREVEEDLLQIGQLKTRPLNINLATADELSVFPFLTAYHIEQFMAYRNMLGPLHHVMELQAVPGWDVVLIRKILPYVFSGSIEGFRKRLVEDLRGGRQMILFRTAPGRNAGFLARYHFQSPSVRFGLTLDKDRGEVLFQRGKGISFLSAHLSYTGSGIVRRLLIGDHLVSLGQGLLLWQGRAVRKTGMATMIKRQLPVLQDYRSADENRFMRGLAIGLGKRNFGIDLFLNRQKVDANTRTDSMGFKEITSFLYTGLHRTEKELEDKDAVRVFSYGFSAYYRKNRLKIALNHASNAFSIPVEKGKEPYELYAFSGDQLRGQSISYHYTLRNAHFFGELSGSCKGTALLQGVMLAADKQLDLALVARRIGRGYRAFSASAFTEAGEVNNEEGIYMGISFRPGQQLTMDIYTDHYRSPWLRYRLNRPSYGRDNLAQLAWRPDKKTMLVVRWKQEYKMLNGGNVSAVRKTDAVMREAVRFHLEHQVSRMVEWRGRLEWSWVKAGELEPQRGFLLYSDLFLRAQQKPLSGNFRMLLYHTDSYEARIYAYENDVMYYSSIPAFYGSGFIAYVNIRLKVSDKLDLFVKYSMHGEAGKIATNSRFQLIFSF